MILIKILLMILLGFGLLAIGGLPAIIIGLVGIAVLTIADMGSSG